jgi:hypothetical protein
MGAAPSDDPDLRIFRWIRPRERAILNGLWSRPFPSEPICQRDFAWLGARRPFVAIASPATRIAKEFHHD